MSSIRESIHADTNIDVESEIKNRDELSNINRRNLFLKIYVFLFLLVNLMTFTFYQASSISNLFLIAGIFNIMLSGISISYYYTGQGINQGFTKFKSSGGMLENLGVVENESSWNKPLDQPRFTLFNPSLTIYLFMIPMFIGVILLIFGLFIVWN